MKTRGTLRSDATAWLARSKNQRTGYLIYALSKFYILRGTGKFDCCSTPKSLPHMQWGLASQWVRIRTDNGSINHHTAGLQQKIFNYWFDRVKYCDSEISRSNQKQPVTPADLIESIKIFRKFCSGLSTLPFLVSFRSYVKSIRGRAQTIHKYHSAYLMKSHIHPSYVGIFVLLVRCTGYLCTAQ